MHLVNARHVKKVSGRESDVLDCWWLQQLMSYGFCRVLFGPAEQICVPRALWCQREMLTHGQTRHVQHMQKAPSQMNVQLDNVIAGVNGVTGQRIIRAILAGERDPVKLAQLKHARIRADEATIAKALAGTWREEHLFALKQAVEQYDAYQARQDECDAELAWVLTGLAVHDAREAAPAKRRRGGRPRRSAFNLREALYRACGVDFTAIDGIETGTALKVLAEVGPDLSRFKSAKHFASWLGLCPGDEDLGRQGAVGREPARLQPPCPGAADGGDEPQAQSFGARRLLPAVVRAAAR